MVQGCWYPVSAADELVLLCRASVLDHEHGLCSTHARRVLPARRRRALAASGR